MNTLDVSVVTYTVRASLVASAVYSAEVRRESFAYIASPISLFRRSVFTGFALVVLVAPAVNSALPRKETGAPISMSTLISQTVLGPPPATVRPVVSARKASAFWSDPIASTAPDVTVTLSK